MAQITDTHESAIYSFKTPVKIVGRENMELFKEHYRITTSGTGEFPDKLLNREFTSEIRGEIAKVYQELRANGFYPEGFNGNGEIRWCVAMKSPVFAKLEREMEPVPVTSAELEAMIAKARMAFGNIGMVPDMPEAVGENFKHEGLE